VSPDGVQIALTVISPSGPDVAIYDPRRDSFTKLSFDGTSVNAVWSPPDGEFVVFWNVADRGLRWTRTSGGRPQRLLTPGIQVRSTGSFSPDAKRFAFVGYSETTDAGGGATRANRANIFIVTMAEEGGLLKLGAPKRFSPSDVNELEPQFSPDGHWISFVTDKSGQNEVWARAVPPLPTSDQKVPSNEVKISANSGTRPRWSGKSELLYQSGDQIMAVSYTLNGEALMPQKERIRVEKLGATSGANVWDVAPDGRIVVVTPVEASKAPPADHTVMFLQNFFDEVRRRVK
jgi:Tol biopolymer transport system component